MPIWLSFSARTISNLGFLRHLFCQYSRKCPHGISGMSLFLATFRYFSKLRIGMGFAEQSRFEQSVAMVRPCGQGCFKLTARLLLEPEFQIYGESSFANVEIFSDKVLAGFRCVRSRLAITSNLKSDTIHLVVGLPYYGAAYIQ